MIFRENNFSPEFFFDLTCNKWNGDESLKIVRLGLYQHESTGEAGVGSHGWNLTYIEPVWKVSDITIAPKLWVPALFQSKEKTVSDNLDILDYYGYGELKLYYDQNKYFRHSIMFRQGNSSERYGFAWQTHWAFNPEHHNAKVFIQYWSGYGESLKDYNNSTHGVVIGFSAVAM